MKTIVIGAGAAGLAAVNELNKIGVDVRAFDEKPFAGGRVFSVKRDGFTLDPGAQFFFSCYKTYFRLLKETGLIDELVPFRNVSAIPDSKGGLNRVLVSLKPGDIWTEKINLMKFRGVPVKAILQLIPLIPELIKTYAGLSLTEYENRLTLDNISLSEYVLKKGGRSLLEYIMQPVASCLTLGEPEDISAAYGLALLVSFVQGLYTLKGGIGSLSQRLYEKNKDCINLSSKVDKIIIENNMVKGVETPDGFIEADAVICTVTATAALKLIPDLPDEMKKLLEKVRYSESCHVMFGLEKRIMPEDWYAVAIPRPFGSPQAGFTDSSMKAAGYAPDGAGLISCFTYGRHAVGLNKMTDEEVRKTLIMDIKRYLPTMPDKPVFTEIFRFKEAVCVSPPGMLKSLINFKKGAGASSAKGLYFAGEYMNMPSVEGATKSGIDAAKWVLDYA